MLAGKGVSVEAPFSRGEGTDARHLSIPTPEGYWPAQNPLKKREVPHQEKRIVSAAT